MTWPRSALPLGPVTAADPTTAAGPWPSDHRKAQPRAQSTLPAPISKAAADGSADMTPRACTRRSPPPPNRFRRADHRGAIGRGPWPGPRRGRGRPTCTSGNPGKFVAHTRLACSPGRLIARRPCVKRGSLAGPILSADGVVARAIAGDGCLAGSRGRYPVGGASKSRISPGVGTRPVTRSFSSTTSAGVAMTP